MIGHANREYVVRTEHSAANVGSGDIEVLGTPILVAWLEAATCEALHLNPEETSVGTAIHVNHLAPSAVGELVTVSASVAAEDGRAVHFDVAAHDSHGTKIATGSISRAIVDRTRFLARVADMAN